jgi:putative transposase
VLSQEDFLAWARQNNLSEDAQSVAQNVRSSDPARRVGGGRHNVTGRYPSRKMGVTIQFESHRVELPTIYELEYDDDVLEYFDQPPSFKLDYCTPNGRRLGVLHTPDFFVIRKAKAGWEECKTEEELHLLSERNSNRYCRRGESWICPPGDAYANRFGFYYRVRSSAEINWAFQRNIQFLEDYLRSTPTVSPLSRQRVHAYIAARPGCSLADLLSPNGPGVNQDDVYSMIAIGDLYVDIFSASLSESDRTIVSLEKTLTPAAVLPASKRLADLSTVRTGDSLNWDGKDYQILNIGCTTIALLSEERAVLDVPLPAFEKYINDKDIIVAGCISQKDDGVRRQLIQASESDLAAATYRFQIVSKAMRAEEIPVAARTVRRWMAAYRAAELTYGSGYLGLLPRPRPGNCSHKLPEKSRSLMMEFIERDYETLKQKTQYSTWAAFQLACERQQIPAPSYKTFSLAIHQKAGFQQTMKRRGPRAAYQQEPFFWELEQRTPRHGDRPFEIAHIDHTQADVWVVCSQTGRVMGRPWVSFLSDAFSRRILALYLTFDPPSYRSCMMVLRECVHRHSRLPQIIVVDGGKDFQSTYFETLLARYEIIKKTRPPAKARFGSTCERIFGTANQHFFHNLAGNTQLSRSSRQVTKSVDPRNHAVWTIRELSQHLSDYAYEVYDTLDHPALGQSPREAFAAGIARTGARAHRRVAYDQEFLIFTLPTTRKGVAKISPGLGVKINHLYYWSEQFRNPTWETRLVPVRYDPFDVGTAFAFVGKQWIECHSEYYAAFHGHSEREVHLATEELRKRLQNHSGQFQVTAKKLAAFLESVEIEESVLAQRLADLEARGLKCAVEVSTRNQINYPRSVPMPHIESGDAPLPQQESIHLYGEL